MFNEIGNKLKILASVVLLLGIFVSVIIGIVLISTGSNMYYGGEGLTTIGVIILCLGWLPSYIGSLFVYGFGELIDKTTEIARNTGSNVDNPTDETSSEEPAQAETQTEQTAE